MQVIDILKAAKAKIEKPENWGKGDYVHCEVDGTYKFCALGALYHVCDVKAAEPSWLTGAESRLRDAVESITGERTLVQYNDAKERTHEEIMTVYNVAIQLAVEKA
jgi:hypothetical protein